MVIVVVFFSSAIILNSPPMVLALMLGAIMAVIFIKKPAWALAILIVLGTNIFGAVPFTDLPSIPLPGLGSLFPHDILLLLFTGIMSLKFFRERNTSIRSSIGYPIIALILLTVMQAIRSFLEGNNPHFIVAEMRPIAFYLSYFLVIGSFKRENELITFMKSIFFIAVISAGVTYYQTITGGLNIASNVFYSVKYNIYQSLNLAMFVMTCTFLILFSLSIGRGINFRFFSSTNMALIWIGGAILIMLMRNIWASTLLAMGIIIVELSASRS